MDASHRFTRAEAIDAASVLGSRAGSGHRDPRSTMAQDNLELASRNAFPLVAHQRSGRDKLGLLGGAALALGLGALTFLSMSGGREGTPAPKAETRPSADHAVALDPRLTPTKRADASPPLANPAPFASPLTGPVTGSPYGMPSASPLTGPSPQNQPFIPGVTTPRSSRGGAPTLVFDGSGGTVGDRGTTSAVDSLGGEVPSFLAPGGEGAGGRVGVADGNIARAVRLADPTQTVVQGTLIPAVLETAINSDLPGYARAIVSADVRSFDGSRVVIPRASRLVGEYKTATQAGQRRVYLIWTRLIRPDGVSVALSSPAVGASGEAGLSGKVSDHFLQRFGSAMLLSLLGGAGTLLGGNAPLVIGGGQSAASVAAQQNGGRMPTIRVAPGEPIRVFTAKDLSFALDGR